MPKDASKPKRGKSAYLFYSQAVRDSVKAANPDLDFGQLGKTIGKMWGSLSDAEKQPYVQQAEADKQRYAAEMATYTPPAGSGGTKKAKKKDGPKHPLSPYIFFTQAMRETIKSENPGLAPKEVMSKLGEKWRELSEDDKKVYQAQADADKLRYQREKEAFEGAA